MPVSSRDSRDSARNPVRTNGRDRHGPLLAVLLSGQVMASMDGSIVNVALPSVQRDLQADGAALQLVVSGYLLALGVLIVTGARLGDLLGHRRAFLAGLAGFTVTSLLCGLAASAPLLVAARVAQGATAALMIPQIFSLIQLRLDGPALKRAVGLYSLVLALGVALGQLAGGLIVGADLFGLSWRPAFLVNVPVGVVLLAAGARLLPRSERVPQRLDLAGVGLLTAAMILLITPLVFGREHGWPAAAWLAIPAAAALFFAFVRLEHRVKRRGGLPLLDPDVVRPAGVGPALLACLLVMGCYAAFLFVFTLHVQGHLGFGPLAAGLAFAPYTAGFAALSLTWARMPRRVQFALPVAGPLVFASLAVVTAVAFAAGLPISLLAPLLFAAGAGHAAGYSPLIARLPAVVGPRHASALSALNSAGPMLASVLAIAALGGLHLAAGATWTLTAIAAVLLAASLHAVIAHRGLGRVEDAGRAGARLG